MQKSSQLGNPYFNFLKVFQIHAIANMRQDFLHRHSFEVICFSSRHLPCLPTLFTIVKNSFRIEHKTKVYEFSPCISKFHLPLNLCNNITIKICFIVSEKLKSRPGGKRRRYIFLHKSC